MPYSNPKQPTAIFLNIKRRKGEAAAKAFARKHREEMSASARYRSRSQRSQ